MRDFSLDMLEVLLIAYRDAGFQFVRFDDYYRNRGEHDHQGNVVLFRHDVDRYPLTALATAQVEARLGLYGTYYFRSRSWTFKPAIMKAIADLGHEIGYHYECLPDTRGDFGKAADLCRSTLERFRAHVPVTTVSMHSRPLSKWDGRLLWDRYNLANFGLLGEAYRSIDHNRYVYIADSGRNWNADRNVIWDTVDGAVPPRMEKGTKGLIKAIEEGKFGSIQLLIHPNRWPAGLPQWVSQSVQDLAINAMKNVARSLKRRGRGGSNNDSTTGQPGDLRIT